MRSCPTCDHTMQNLGGANMPLLWCPRCGTVDRASAVFVPDLRTTTVTADDFAVGPPVQWSSDDDPPVDEPKTCEPGP